MTIYLFHGGIKVKQVNKTTARKMYNDGKKVYLHSCNMRPNNMWQSPCPISKDTQAWDNDTFDGQVNEYEWYNCDNERGRYANFFVEVD